MTDLSGKFVPQEPGPIPTLQVVATLGAGGVAWNITPKPGERHFVTIDAQTLVDGSLYVNEVSIRVSEL